MTAEVAAQAMSLAEQIGTAVGNATERSKLRGAQLELVIASERVTELKQLLATVE